MEIIVNNIEELDKVVKCVRDRNKSVVILSGSLGSGKTTFVKEFVKYLGLDDNVTSPTFSIQNVYSNLVFHYDLYNKDVYEFLALGMLEELEKEGWHFIEWGEELEEVLKNFGFDFLKITIIVDNDKRIFKCQD